MKVISKVLRNKFRDPMDESLPGRIFKSVFNVLFESKGGCKE